MNILRRTILIAAAFAASTFLPVAASELPPFPFLLVEGKATAEVRPDKATLSVYVTAFDPDSVVALETVQRQLIILLSTLAEHSIPDDAITSYNLAKEVERERKDRIEMQIVGYHVSRRVKVELRDISTFAPLVADIARIDNVASLDADFDVTGRESIELKLMNEAGADARRVAENMVHGMSRTVGDVFGISNSSIRSSVAAFAFGNHTGFAANIAMAGYQRTIFEPATIELRQSIHVMFELD